MLTITALSHLDHGLTTAHLRFVLDRYRDRDAFFIETVELPQSLAALECGLYGPIMGDSPIAEADVVWQPRAGRQLSSRLVRLPPRPTRLLTIVAGPHEAFSCLLYTSFGGPAAPRELGDPALTGIELEAARGFWLEHALAL